MTIISLHRVPSPRRFSGHLFRITIGQRRVFVSRHTDHPHYGFTGSSLVSHCECRTVTSLYILVATFPIPTLVVISKHTTLRPVKLRRSQGVKVYCHILHSDSHSVSVTFCLSKGYCYLTLRQFKTLRRKSHGKVN